MALQTRRITALLLTAFLVAELLWRWQGGIAQPASTSGVWTQVTSGAYHVSQGFFVPTAGGSVLMHTARGISDVHPVWSARVRKTQVAIYGWGTNRIAVAQSGPHAWVLPRYGKGYLLLDDQQNFWEVQNGRVSLVLGGGTGDAGRQALMDRTASLQQQGVIPNSWQLVWASDPLVVGDSIWYLSNRDGALGVASPHVWQLHGTVDRPIPELSALGRLSLLAAQPGGVVALNAQGGLLHIDPANLSITGRLQQYLPLATGPLATLALQPSPGQTAKLFELGADWGHPKELKLPQGVQALGPAGYSADGGWLALLVRRDEEILLYVTRASGKDALHYGQLLAPPDGTQIEVSDQPSIWDGRVYLVVQSGGKEQTWSRSVADGESAIGLHGARQFAVAATR